MNGEHDKLNRPAPGSADDAGSQALAEALRSSFGLVKVLMILMVLAFLGSGFFTVGLQERAIKLRLGRPVGEPVLIGPGLHWAYPYPIDEVQKVPFTEVQRVSSTTGWDLTPQEEMAPAPPPMGNSLPAGVRGYLLTADGNIVHCKATLSYRINDPVRFLFGFTNATQVVVDALDNALIFSAARFTVDDILTRDVEAFREAVRRRADQLIEDQKVGILVDRCDIQTSYPRYLATAFNRVTDAKAASDKAINHARTYESSVTNSASAEAASIRNAAESDRTRLVTEVQGEVLRFQGLLPVYRTNTALFVQQRLNETVARVMTNAQDKWYLPARADGQPRELRLLLNREPPKQRAEAAP
jgi:membrane protease subunit HflK